MQISYFPNFTALNSTPVLEAFVNGCRINGINIVENSMDADAAVIWSVLWNGRMQNNQQVYQHYRSTGRPVIVIDVGALKRGITWKVAVNHITNEGFYGHTDNLDYDRPAKLNLKLDNTKSNNPAILIAAQHKKSLSVSSLESMEQWISDVVGRLKQITTRPIVIRQHPRSRLDVSLLPTSVTIDYPQKLIDTYDSYNISYGYHAVVNYNSSPGIHAAFAGTRPIVAATSLAYPVSVNFEDIEKEYTPDRNQWLVEIAHTEYTIEEIAQGLWIKRLAPMLNL